MKLSSLRLKHFFVSFLRILNPIGIVPIGFSRLTSAFCTLLHFLQLLSYVFKLEGLNYADPKVTIFSNIIFYSNYINILYYFGSDILTYIVYSLSFIGLFGVYSYWILVTVGQVLKMQRFLDSKVNILMNRMVISVFSLYDWVVFTPTLEIFINVFNEGWDRFVVDRNVFLKGFEVFSALGLVMAVSLGFVLFLFNRGSLFLDRNHLKSNNSIFLLIAFILRIILILAFEIFSDRALGNLVYFLLIAIGILRLIDYCSNFSIIDEIYSRMYIGILSIFLLFIAYFTYLGMQNVLFDSNSLYQLGFLAILTVKLSQKLQEWFYNRMIISGQKEDHSFINYVEEIYRFYQDKTYNAKSSFYFGGLLALHHKECTFRECPLKTLNNNFNNYSFEKQEFIMKRLMSEYYLHKINSKQTKKNLNLDFLEKTILKYTSFSIHFNISKRKAFFEILNIIKSNKNSKSFYFQHVSEGFLKGIKEDLRLETLEDNGLITNKKEIPLHSFFDIIRGKKILQNKLNSLLKRRLLFWEVYKEGFQSYEELISKSYDLINDITSYRDLLNNSLKGNIKGSNQNLIFVLKFHSIFSCVVVNNINEGLRFEDQLEKIMKREMTLEQNILNCHSFFNDKLVIIQASFLKFDGILLESCKTAKLANFFKYSLTELKNIKSINTFMPKFIGSFHNDRIAALINETPSEGFSKANRKKKNTVETYAIDKEGFIFPIKMYIGQTFFHSLNDLVFETAMLNLGFDSEITILIDKEGCLQGMSRGFMEILQRNQVNNSYSLTTQDMVGLINFFCFMPGLEEILNENLGENSTKNGKLSKFLIRNVVQNMKLPVNMKEVLDILKEKEKEEEIFSHYSSRSGNKSSKSRSNQLNNSKTSKFLSLFFSTVHINSHSRSQIEEKYLKKQLTAIDILRKLQETQKTQSFRVILNIEINRIKIKEQEPIIISINIHKINKIDDKNFFENSNSSLIKGELTERQSDDMKEEPDLNINMPSLNPLAFKKNKEEMILEDEKSLEFLPNVLNGNEKENPLSSSFKFEEDVNNRLFTTEADQFFEKTNHNQVLEAPRNQTETHLSQEKINKITKKESLLNSIESEELRKYEGNKEKTSLQKIYEGVDRTSQASSLSSLKKTFSIFNMIKLIQNYLPTNIRNFSLLQFMEFIVILIYCIVIYESCLTFLTKYYDPLQNSLENYAHLFTSYCSSNLLAIDMLYRKQGLLDNNEYEGYKELYYKILNQNFDEMKGRIYKERSKNTEFPYQELTLNTFLPLLDIDKNLITSILFDDFVGEIQEKIYQLKEVNSADLNINTRSIQFLSLNFQTFNEFYIELTDEISKEFILYNDLLSFQVQAVMIGLLCVIFLIKILEIWQILALFQRLTKLMNIFLRINTNEAYNEALLTKQISDSLSDPYDKFLNVNYPDRVLNRKNVVTQTEEDLVKSRSSLILTKESSIKTKKKTSKKFSLHNIKPISKTPLIVYILVSFFLMFGYIFFNFYFAEVVTRDKVNNLIGVASFFENLFTAPATVFVSNNIIYSDKLYGNPLYIKNTTNFQSTNYENLLNNLANTEKINIDLPNYAYNQALDLGDNLVITILNGDICKVLYDNQLIDIQERNLCQINLNGAFTKGLVNVISMIINSLKSQEDMLKVLISPSNTQIDQIKLYLQGLGWNDSISMSNMLYNKCAKIIFIKLNEYYRSQIEDQLKTLEAMLLITSILMMLLYISLIMILYRVMAKIYRNCTVLMNLIPFEKLINDEQTSFLLKSLWRNDS